MNFKNIHIGELIEQRVNEKEIELLRMTNFLKCSEVEIKEMFEAENLPTDVLLRWCKLLEYDFFRIYTQHLILYSPSSNNSKSSESKIQTRMPIFRKNIYTEEIIQFILEQIDSGEMNKTQIIEKYNIPKTTLNKWINKHKI